MTRVALTEVERDTLRGVAFIRGLKSKVIARQIGISPSLLGKWQNGLRRPSQQQLAEWWRIITDTS